LPLAVLCTGIVQRAKGAADVVAELLDGLHDELSLVAAGIDAPLFWQAAGDRMVDQMVRSKISQCGASSSTVNNVNSMPGACVIQGMMAAMLLRKTYLNIALTESHPKALLSLLGKRRESTSLTDLPAYFTIATPKAMSEDERDAALGALAAYAMSASLNGWQDLYPHEMDAITPLDPRPGYWMPW